MRKCTGHLVAVQSEITSVNIDWIYAYYCVEEEENKIVCKISKILTHEGKWIKNKQKKKKKTNQIGGRKREERWKGEREREGERKVFR